MSNIVENQNEGKRVVMIYKNIPTFLHKSEFYLSLSSDDPNEPIEIPKACFKEDDYISSPIELVQLLRTIEYWGLAEIPLSVLIFCAHSELENWDKMTRDSVPELHMLLVLYFKGKNSVLAAVAAKRREFLMHWLMCNPPTSDCTAMIDVDSIGDLVLLMELHQLGYPWNELTCAAAARGGHLDCLMFLHEMKCVWDSNTVRRAAQASHIQCLKYALENNCPIDKNACMYVVGCANAVELLTLLRAYNIPWKEAVATKATHVDLSILQYTLNNGCPYDDTLVMRACEPPPYMNFFNLNTCIVTNIQYLIEEQLLVMDNTVFSAALAYGNLSCVQYLVDVGCPCKFVELGIYERVGTDMMILQCIQYALDHGWKSSGALVKFAITRDLPACLRYLKECGATMPKVYCDCHLRGMPYCAGDIED